MRKRLALGFLYGLVLLFIGGFFAGGGHGFYLFLIIANSPVSMFGDAGMLVCPLTILTFWTVLALLTKKQKRAGKLLLAVHYVGILVTLLRPPPYAPLLPKEYSLPVLFVILCPYLIGQAFFWVNLVKMDKEP